MSKIKPHELPERYQAQIADKTVDDVKQPAQQEVEKAQRKAEYEKWELEFAMQLSANNIHHWEREYRFVLPGGQSGAGWKFDFAFPDVKVAIEIEGGIWRPGGGAHSRPQNIERDIKKYNAALRMGWAVYRLTPEMVKSGSELDNIEGLIQSRRKAGKEYPNPAILAPRLAKCKSCEKEIFWMKTHHGNNIPVDPPVSRDDRIFDRDLHTCHFDTCEHGTA